MPAVITHDMFGREVYGELHGLIGETKDAHDAFMLGCQGPDVLFFGALNPLIAPSWGLGTTMHRTNPGKLLKAFRDEALKMDNPIASPIAEAYVMGLYCHYALDSTLHPFIYSQQYALCDAGVEGLDRSDGHEVHAEIESELDVLTLTAKDGRTISQFDPSREILVGHERVLIIISVLYKRVSVSLFGKSIPTRSYEQSAKAYRLTLKALYSPRGVKRELFGRAEELFRKYSFVRAMSHKSQLLEKSVFDNRKHRPWKDPFTGEVRCESYWELYGRALAKSRLFLLRIMDASAEDFERETQGLDFNGRPTTVRVLSVEDA